MSATIIAGFLARESYALLFVCDAATTWLYGIIVWRKLPETQPIVSAERAQGPKADLRTVLGDGVFMVFVGLSFVTSVIFLQHNSTLPMDMSSRGITESTYGLVIALNGLLIIVVQPFATHALRRFRRSRVLAFAALVIGAGFGIYALPGSAAWYGFGVAIWTFGEIAMSPTSSAIVADLAPTHARGRYQGVFMMSFGLAGFVAPTAGALILARRGAPTLWVGCFALGAFVALGHLAIAEARLRRLERVRAAASA
jgi:MFS family permease